jgi:predicted transcriptional regulator
MISMSVQSNAEKPMKARSETRQMYDILRCISEDESKPISRINGICGLTHGSTKKYLQLFLVQDIAVCSHGNYSISARGREFLNYLEETRKHLQEFGMDL